MDGVSDWLSPMVACDICTDSSAAYCGFESASIQTENFFLKILSNQSVKVSKYNLISVWFNIICFCILHWWGVLTHGHRFKSLEVKFFIEHQKYGSYCNVQSNIWLDKHLQHFWNLLNYKLFEIWWEMRQFPGIWRSSVRCVIDNQIETNQSPLLLFRSQTAKPNKSKFGL